MAALAKRTTMPQNTASNKLTLLYFWAPWNNLCQVESMLIDELAQHYADRLDIVWLNIDERPDLAARYAVDRVPTLLLLQDGQVRQTFVGYANRRAVNQAIEQAVAD